MSFHAQAYVPDARTVRAMMVRGIGGLGADTEQTLPPIATCPLCSYFQNGDCKVCEKGDPHPGCQGCKNGGVVWYRNPTIVAVVTGITTSILAAITLSKLRDRGIV